MTSQGDVEPVCPACQRVHVADAHETCNHRYFYMLAERDRWERRYYDAMTKVSLLRFLLVGALIAILGLVIR